jgi:hypothetical protein
VARIVWRGHSCPRLALAANACATVEAQTFRAA